MCVLGHMRVLQEGGEFQGALCGRKEPTEGVHRRERTRQPWCPAGGAGGSLSGEDSPMGLRTQQDGCRPRGKRGQGSFCSDGLPLGTHPPVLGQTCWGGGPVMDVKDNPSVPTWGPRAT
jgi:hypothetical protein